MSRIDGKAEAIIAKQGSLRSHSRTPSTLSNELEHLGLST